MSDSPDPDQENPERWTLARDIAVLQVKLVVDGFRDLLLVPASLIAGMISLFASENGKPAPHFYRLLRFGRHSERWINLFGAYENSPEYVDAADAFGDASIDDIVGRLETFVVDEYRRGGVTAQARAKIDKALSAIQRAAHEPDNSDKKGSEPEL